MSKVKRRAVYVEWVDSAGSNGWHTLGELDVKVMRCQTLGWLARETKDTLMIALNGVFDGTSSRPLGECIVIPKCCITKRKWVAA